MNDIPELIETLDARTSPVVARGGIDEALKSRLGLRFIRKFQR